MLEALLGRKEIHTKGTLSEVKEDLVRDFKDACRLSGGDYELDTSPMIAQGTGGSYFVDAEKHSCTFRDSSGAVVASVHLTVSKSPSAPSTISVTTGMKGENGEEGTQFEQALLPRAICELHTKEGRKEMELICKDIVENTEFRLKRDEGAHLEGIISIMSRAKAGNIFTTSEQDIRFW